MSICESRRRASTGPGWPEGAGWVDQSGHLPAVHRGLTRVCPLPRGRAGGKRVSLRCPAWGAHESVAAHARSVSVCLGCHWARPPSGQAANCLSSRSPLPWWCFLECWPDRPFSWLPSPSRRQLGQAAGLQTSLQAGLGRTQPLCAVSRPLPPTALSPPRALPSTPPPEAPCGPGRGPPSPTSLCCCVCRPEGHWEDRQGWAQGDLNPTKPPGRQRRGPGAVGAVASAPPVQSKPSGSGFAPGRAWVSTRGGQSV